MSKELELIIDLIIEFDELGFEPTTLCDTQKEVDSFRNRLIKVRDYLKSLDNANPSEALECLEFLGDLSVYRDIGNLFKFHFKTEFGIIKQALIKADLDKRIAEEYDEIIKKQEKVLKIAFEKPLSLFVLKMFKKYGKNVLELDYQSFVDGYKIIAEDFNEDMNEQIVIEEEFELLKRWVE